MDNLSAHSAPPVAEWLAHPKRERWHLHLTPTGSSWLNLIESWFAQLTNRRLRNGTFTSVNDLIDAMARGLKDCAAIGHVTVQRV